MEYFKVKSLLTQNGQACIVKIGTYIGEKEGNYGMQYEYDVTVNGTPMKWMASAHQHKNINEIGEEEFTLQRYDSNGRTGFNYIKGSDADHISMPPPVQAPQSVASQPPRDDIGERIIRGMAGNQAANLLAPWAKDRTNEEIVQRKFQLTKMLYDNEHTWYSNSEV